MTPEEIAAVLDLHVLHASMNLCTGCDWRPKHDHQSLAKQHRAHQAEVLAALMPEATESCRHTELPDTLWPRLRQAEAALADLRAKVEGGA